MYKKHLSILIASLMLSGCVATYGGKDPSANEGKLISYQYVFEGKKDLKTDAVFRKPASVNSKHPAVIILHDGGGWITERTRQYADLFIANGYATLEPRLFFDEKATRTLKKDLASLYSALEYLSKQPEIDKNKIYVVGMSAGANLAMLAKAKMAGETFSRSDTQFKAIAALYPVCWGFSDTIDGKPPSVFTGFSIANMQNWQSTPIRLFIPELDDYDDKDTKTCDNFIEKIPSNEARSTFSVKVYAGATHGWDHGKTYSFPTSYACKGKGCINTNQSNPTVTQQGYTDILEFFNSNQSQ